MHSNLHWVVLALALSLLTISIANAAEQDGSYVDAGGLKRNADGTLDHTALNLRSGREALRENNEREKRAKSDAEPPITSQKENLHSIQKDRHRRIREHRREQRELDMAISHSLKGGLADKSREPTKEAILAAKKGMSEEQQKSIVEKHRRIKRKELDDKSKAKKDHPQGPSYSQSIKVDAEERERRRQAEGPPVDASLEEQHTLEKHANKIRIELESTHPPGVDPKAQNYGLRYQATHMATFQIYVQTTDSHYSQFKADKAASVSKVPLARPGPLSKAVHGSTSNSASPSLSAHDPHTADENKKSDDTESKSLSKAFTRPVPLMDGTTNEVDYSQYTELGNITFALFGRSVPWTVTNFIGLCNGDKGFGYANSTIHRIVQDYVIQGGDFEYHDGRGGHSYFCDPDKDELCNYKAQREELRKENSKSKSKSLSLPVHRKKMHSERTHFRHENYNVAHTEGTLSMADDDRKSTGSQWFINIDHKSRDHMDKKFVAFGHVVHGFRSTAKALNFMRTDAKHRPIRSILIKGCHVQPYLDREVAWQYEHERQLLHGDIPTGTTTLRRMLTERGGADWAEHRKNGGTWDSLNLWMTDADVPSTWQPLVGGSVASRHKRKQIRDADDDRVEKAKELGSKAVLDQIAKDEENRHKSLLREVERVKEEMVKKKMASEANPIAAAGGADVATDDGPLKALTKGRPNRRPSRSIIPPGMDPAVHTEEDIIKAVSERREAAALKHRRGPRRVFEEGMGLFYTNYEDSDDDEEEDVNSPRLDEHDDVFNEILTGPAKGSHQAAHSIRNKKLQERDERRRAYLTRHRERSKSLPTKETAPTS